MTKKQQEIEFGNLLRRHCKILNSICLRFCGGNRFYYEELWQECAVELWAEYRRYGVTRFREESLESTWVFRIAYHAVRHYYRSKKNEEFATIENLEGIEKQANIEETEGWKLLDEISEKLNNKERVMLEHLMNGDSYSTIARTEGITESNARKRMSRLIKKLKMLTQK